MSRLYLIPTPLGDLPPAHCLPPPAISIVAKLDVFLAESPKTARAFLKRAYADAGIDRTLTAITIHELSNSTPEERLREWLADPRDIGVVSEAGAPGIADPGASVVRVAHTVGRAVHPLVGPSSITLALMASGLGGQHFEFHGYLPVKQPALSEHIVALERAALRTGATQIFIEAPYRNDRLVAALLDACCDDTQLCLATDLTLATESIRMQTIGQWRTQVPAIDRRPTVFLLKAAARVRSA